MDQTLNENLRLALEAQRAAYRAEPMPSLAVRRDRLQRVLDMTRKHADEIADAVSRDFGHRSRHETLLADIATVEIAARHALRHLPRWMRQRRMPTALHYLPSRNRLIAQPLGVVGVIAPWNYPYQLAMSPALAALAAGNRVLIKPSELTPATSALMARLVGEYFAPEEMSVITGDVAVGRAFAALPFDHLFFTGSTTVGKAVAQTAAQNLTPVTLELGGKSPALVHPSADIELAAERIAFGKLINAGQTCIAPDYLLVPREMQAAMVDAILAAVRRLYPAIADNPDYTSIASDRFHARLRELIADAQAKGAKPIPTHDESTAGGRKLVPHLLLDVNDSMTVMQQEIFGPLLPVVPYDSEHQALDYITRRDRPLALYWFGRDGAARDRALLQTHAGGVTVNGSIWHIGQEDQPFGGVGASGQGAYHGVWGFHTFTKLKPVFVESRLSGTRLFHPPFGAVFERLLGLLRRIA